MTTDIRIRTNGNYVAEGKLVITNQQSQDIKVGPGTPAEKSFNVPHGSQVTIHINERPATVEEIAAAAVPA